MSVGAVNKQTGDRIPTAGMPVVDSILSGSSTNPVQNKVVKEALDGKVDAENGKGLSTNDYTNTDKAKVAASLNVFTGTHTEWEELSTAEKKAYQRADFTDDYDPTAIGNMTDLHTSTKSSIVGAINEVADGKQNATDNNLQTTSKTIVGGINEVKSGLINPVSGTVVVTLPTNPAYGFYYFLLLSTAFAFGKTVTIVSANFIGDSTELKDYISPETQPPTEIGRIYKIQISDATGVSAATYGNPLMITYTVA